MDLATPKERNKEKLNKEHPYPKKGIRQRVDDPDKYIKGKYGHLVARTQKDIERIRKLRQGK